jgi:membrane associated rhomboid family serine protease
MSMQPIRIAATASQADEWALVLTAAGIPNTVEPDARGWAVLAAPDDTAHAFAALAAYDDERRQRASPTPVALEPYPWMSGIALGLLLLWFFSVTGAPTPGSLWFERGAAAAGRVLGGEPWRAVTALTLHADIVHVAGNAVALAVLVPAIVQRFGAGGTLLLLLLAGGVGNVFSAIAHDARHVAVGASTAAFGAVGILVALRLVPDEAQPRGKRWPAPVAGLLLLVTLGAAPGADLTAHAFGFVAGVGLGFATGVGLRRRPRPSMQWILGGLAATALAVCWRLALRP